MVKNVCTSLTFWALIVFLLGLGGFITGYIAYPLSAVIWAFGVGDFEVLAWNKFGTSVKINHERIIASEPARALTINNEVREWLKESIRFPYKEMNAEHFIFMRRKDAVLFKLMWG